MAKYSKEFIEQKMKEHNVDLSKIPHPLRGLLHDLEKEDVHGGGDEHDHYRDIPTHTHYRDGIHEYEKSI
jgi:hypothetical protein